VVNGGLFDAPSIYVGSNTWGRLTCNGGILQFRATTPGISIRETGGVVLTNGTISFRNVTAANVAWQDAKIVYGGNNSFRLNHATNATTGQSYVFDTGLGASHYYRLELVNRVTRYRGGAGDRLAIGSGGSMLVSNTTATVDLVFTNNGTLTITKSTLTLNQPANLQGTLRIDLGNLGSPSGVLAAGNLTLGPSSTLALYGTPPEDGATLCTYSGTRSGTFGSVTGLPDTYGIRYGAASNGSILLVRLRGTMITVR
jgi:hypothetical protein